MPFDPTKLSIDPNTVAAVDLHEQLIAARGSEYGDTITPTDQWIKDHIEELKAATSPFTLIMIYHKALRALASPNKRDHYDDIIGYAKLALRRLDDEEIPASHWLHER